MGKTSTLFCDATGRIVSMKGTQYKSDTVLYYSLVLSHPHSDCPPVGVAECISTERSECFRRSEAWLKTCDHSKTS